MTENEARPDVLKVQGRMTRGYGIIPKMPMQDQRLTIEAKAIYSYFCSYAGAGTTAFPSRDKILHDLQIGETRYYKHFNLLKQYGYISVEQNTDNKGKFKNNIYTLIEMIEPYPQNRGTEPYPHFPGTDNPDTENEGAKNNNTKITTFDNQQSKSKSKSYGETELSTIIKEKPKNDMTLTNDTDTTQKDKNIFKHEKELPTTVTPTTANGLQESSSANSKSDIDDYTAYRKIIQDNIDYSHFLHNCRADIELVDELINCMLDVICTKGNTVKINSEEKSRSMVISQYLKINSMDIEHVIKQYKEQHHKITHLHAYLKTMLYTVKQEGGHYYTNAVRADGVVW